MPTVTTSTTLRFIGHRQQYFTPGSASQGALVSGGGSAADPITNAEANKNFFGYWTKATYAGGTSRGTYLRHYIGGAGQEGECLRVFTTVAGVAAAGGVHGAHITGSLDATGSATGLLVGVRATLGVTAATRTVGGTLAALQVDSDIGANNTISHASFIRVADNGSVKVSKFLEIANTGGCLKGSAATGSASDALAVLMPDGSTKYISLVAAS